MDSLIRKGGTPLRQRIIEDMRMRKLEPRAQVATSAPFPTSREATPLVQPLRL